MYIIEEDSSVGFYLYVIEKGKRTHDYLQDSLELAKEFAEKDLGVDLGEWKQVRGNPV